MQQRLQGKHPIKRTSGTPSHTQQESREGKVDLEADDPTEIELMVQFIYSDKYYYKGEKVTDDNAHELLDSCGMDMRMYVLGDKYGINFLKEYAEDRLSNRRILGSRHGGCSRDIAMIRFAYTHSAPDDKTLKRMVVGEMYKHWQSNLLNTFDKSAWMELAAEVPEFIADVMKEIAKERMPGACLPGPLEEASSES